MDIAFSKIAQHKLDSSSSTIIPLPRHPRTKKKAAVYFPAIPIIVLLAAVAASPIPIFAEQSTVAKVCFESFESEALALCKAQNSSTRLTELFKTNKSFAQRLMRNRFRQHAELAAVGKEHDSDGAAKEVDILAAAWLEAYPKIPPVIPWPEARRWLPDRIARYWRAAQATRQAQYLYARGLFGEAKKIWEGARNDFQELRALHAESYLWMNLGLCHYESGNLKDSESHMRRALVIKEQFSDDEGRRDCYMNLSLIAEMRSRYQEAEFLLANARELNAPLCDKVTEARIVASLGVVASQSGKLRKAESYYRTSLALRRETGDQEGEATDISNLGVVLIERGLLPEALSAFQEALALRLKIGDRDGEADSLINLSQVHALMGRTSESLDFFFKGLKILETMGSPQRIIDVWKLAGDTYLQEGNFRQADTFFRAALDEARRRSFPAEVANCQVDLAKLESGRDNYDGALALLQEASQIFQAAENRLGESKVLAGMGRVYRQKGDLAAGAYWLLQGFRMATQEGLEQIAAECALELGSLALQQEKALIAEQYFRMAQMLAQKSGQAYKQWQAHEGLSKCYEMQGRLYGAEFYLKLALAQVLEMEAELPLTSLALHFWDNKADLFRRMSRYSQHREDIQTAWAWADFMKARLFRRSDAARSIEKTAIRKASAEALQEEPLREELRRLFLNMSRTEEADAQNMAKWSLRIEELGRSRQNVPSMPAFPKEAAAMDTTKWLPQLQERLRGDEALIEFQLHEDETWVWIITRRDTQFTVLDIGEAKLKELMLEAGLSDDGSGTENLSSPTADVNAPANPLKIAALPNISRQIWVPLQKRIPGNIRSLAIVPDGVLHLLPFEILALHPDADPQADSLTAAPILSRYAISYLEAAALLDATSKPVDKPKLRVVVLAPPGISAPPHKIRMTAQEQDSGRPRLNETASGSAPMVGSEIAALIELFPEAQVFRGIDAQRTQFVAAVTQADILHIASHYAFNSRRPELSQLALATEGSSAQPFYAFDAALLNTHADLAVLSACATARGEVHPGEGFVNLGRVFLLAGARAVLLSLWPVEEESTTQLMVHFYRLLAQGQDTREALRGAKLALRNTTRWRHPFYWGAFVLAGNPGTIQEVKEGGIGLAIVAGTVLTALVLLASIVFFRR